MFTKVKKLLSLLKHQRCIRAWISTQLSILENDADFSLGGLNDEEEKALIELFHRDCTDRKGPIIEFGTLFGVTTLLLASLKKDERKIITVDNFCWNPFGLKPEQHRAFTSKFLRYGISTGDIELVVQDSATFRANYSGAIPSFVFLDADHSYAAVRDEIAWAKQLGVRVIAGHDYNNHKFDVTRAVDEAFPQNVQIRGRIWWHTMS